MYPILLDVVNVYATLGEITGVFRQVFGEYQEPGVFLTTKTSSRWAMENGGGRAWTNRVSDLGDTFAS